MKKKGWNKTKVILLVRSYNDLDCRMPLLVEFIKDPNKYEVQIIGIPTNKGSYDPKKHELYNYLLSQNISIQAFYDLFVKNLFIKTVYKLSIITSEAVGTIRRTNFRRIAKFGTRNLFKMLSSVASKRKDWRALMVDKFKSSIIITDEIIFQKGRSFVVDELTKKEYQKHYSIYSFCTGQNTYLNLWNDKKVDTVFKLNENVDVPALVPSKNDENVMLGKLPIESIEVVGNTRCDSSWINTLAEIASTKIEKDQLLKREFSRKIVFMLSKIEYGVDLQKLIETIDSCSRIEKSCVIVKPHTRGMTFDTFENKFKSNVHNGARYSSNELIVWTDTVLFTGSSIIFQAMLLEKNVIFLKYCQRYETIFDNTNALNIAQNADDTINMIISTDKYRINQDEVNMFLSENVHNGISSGLVCKSIKSKIEALEEEKRRYRSN